MIKYHKLELTTNKEIEIIHNPVIPAHCCTYMPVQSFEKHTYVCTF